MSRNIFIAFCMVAMTIICTADEFISHRLEAQRADQCGDGMTLIGQFFNCTKPLMTPYRIDENWVKPGYTLNQGILSHISTYCGMVLPRGARCLQSKLRQCDHKTRDFVIHDVNGAGGFCSGNSVSGGFRDLLMSLPAASPRSVERCPPVDYRSCYSAISRDLYTKEVIFLSAPDLAPYVKRTFESVFLCLVNTYRAERAQCSAWQLNMLWRHATTFLPHPLGFYLRPHLLRPLYP